MWHPDITFHSDGQHLTNLITMDKAGNNTHRAQVRRFLLNMSSAGPNLSMLPFLYTGISRLYRQPATCKCVLSRVQGAGWLPATGFEAPHVVGAPSALDLLPTPILCLARSS